MGERMMSLLGVQKLNAKYFPLSCFAAIICTEQRVKQVNLVKWPGYKHLT